MLLPRELRDCRVIPTASPANGMSCMYVMHNFPFVGHGRIVARSV
jgi:hypothetical protein